MKRNMYLMISFFVALFLVIAASPDQGWAEEPGDTTFGNNLSFPVIWSDGVQKTLRGTQEVVEIGGAWWYWWGADENGNPLSCAPDNDDSDFCDDGLPDSVGPSPGGSQMAFLQQDGGNEWQAGAIELDPGVGNELVVDWIDWGDNLEAVPWYLNSMVRVEVVLIQELFEEDDQGVLRHRYGQPVVQYEMRHLFGWGKDEMWGLSTVPDENGNNHIVELDDDASQATVYSHCARLTIQKLVENCNPASLEWDETKWSGACVVDPPIFSGAVREAEDGPGFYSAEINVKGKVIYGYTWDVRDKNEGDGMYRLTFSLDPKYMCSELNTAFSAGAGTQILLPIEEEEEVTVADVTTSDESGNVPSGGTAVILGNQSVTYIDINIIERVTRKGKK